MRIDINHVFSGTNVGCVREVNEDSCDYQLQTPNGHLFVVCDGMGGHVGGATASKIAVDSICNYLKQEKYPDPRKALADALEFANIQILAEAAENPELKGMGTTACVLLIQNNYAWIAHCGDSRIYLYCAEDKWLHRVTKDHSFVQGLVDQGIITDAEAEHHPNKNRITKALGIHPDCLPEVCPQPILPANGDVFLICSDGLSGMVDDPTLQSVIDEPTSLEQKGNTMIEKALQAGGFDNITVQLIEITDSVNPSSMFDSKNPPERRHGEAHSTIVPPPPTPAKPKTAKSPVPYIVGASCIAAIAIVALVVFLVLPKGKAILSERLAQRDSTAIVNEKADKAKAESKKPEKKSEAPAPIVLDDKTKDIIYEGLANQLEPVRDGIIAKEDLQPSEFIVKYNDSLSYDCLKDPEQIFGANLPEKYKEDLALIEFMKKKTKATNADEVQDKP